MCAIGECAAARRRRRHSAARPPAAPCLPSSPPSASRPRTWDSRRRATRAELAHELARGGGGAEALLPPEGGGGVVGLHEEGVRRRADARGSVAELLAREAEQPRAVAAALGVGRDGEEDDVAEQLLDRRVRRRVRPHVVERHQPEGERRLHPAIAVGEEEVRRRVCVEQRRDQPGGQVRERLLAELLELLERGARRRAPLARVVQRHLRGRGAAVRAGARAQGGRAGAARAGPHKPPSPHVTLPVGPPSPRSVRAPCSARRRP